MPSAVGSWNFTHTEDLVTNYQSCECEVLHSVTPTLCLIYINIITLLIINLICDYIHDLHKDGLDFRPFPNSSW